MLAVFPADWSSVCGDQMGLYREIHLMFDECDAQIVSISVDGVWCHQTPARHSGTPCGRSASVSSLIQKHRPRSLVA